MICGNIRWQLLLFVFVRHVVSSPTQQPLRYSLSPIPGSSLFILCPSFPEWKLSAQREAQNQHCWIVFANRPTPFPPPPNQFNFLSAIWRRFCNWRAPFPKNVPIPINALFNMVPSEYWCWKKKKQGSKSLREKTDGLKKKYCFTF